MNFAHRGRVDFKPQASRLGVIEGWSTIRISVYEQVRLPLGSRNAEGGVVIEKNRACFHSTEPSIKSTQRTAPLLSDNRDLGRLPAEFHEAMRDSPGNQDCFGLLSIHTAESEGLAKGPLRRRYQRPLLGSAVAPGTLKTVKPRATSVDASC